MPINANLPESWLIDPTLDGLTDRAYRTFIQSLIYCAGQQSDGRFERRALRYFHPDGVDEQTISELVDAALWADGEHSGELAIVDWAKTQSTRAEIDAQREKNRLYQQRAREKRAKALAGTVSPDDTTDVRPDVSTGVDRQTDRPEDRPVSLSSSSEVASAPPRSPKPPKKPSGKQAAALVVDPKTNLKIRAHDHDDYLLANGTCRFPGCTFQQAEALEGAR